MSKRDDFEHDYGRLYPGVPITPEVMRVLKQTDRKMKYCELDLKTERVRKNPLTGTVRVYPAREDSLDRLMSANHEQFVTDDSFLEEAVEAEDELCRLRLALKQLSPEEWKLVNAIYYQQMSEAETGRLVGISQQMVSYRIRAICRKLKIFMNF